MGEGIGIGKGNWERELLEGMGEGIGKGHWERGKRKGIEKGDREWELREGIERLPCACC